MEKLNNKIQKYEEDKNKLIKYMDENFKGELVTICGLGSKNLKKNPMMMNSLNIKSILPEHLIKEKEYNKLCKKVDALEDKINNVKKRISTKSNTV